MLGLIGTIFFDYSCSNPGKKAFPYRYFLTVPEQFSNLIFKTIGVLKDCRRSFSSRPFWNHSAKFDSGRISEESIGGDYNSFPRVLAFTMAGLGDLNRALLSWISSNYAFEENKVKDDGVLSINLFSYSGRIPGRWYSDNRNLVPVGGLTPYKQTGLYEKGDCYQ